MNSFNIKTYFFYALYIVFTHPLILLFIAGVTLVNSLTVYFPDSGISGLISGVTIISALFVTPIIYGIYYETVEDRRQPLGNLLRTYVPGYLLLLLCMYLPIVVTTTMLLSATAADGGAGSVTLTILLFSLVFLYVVPIFYLTGKIVEAVINGVRFFLRNIMKSAPLLLMALFSELLLLTAHFHLTAVRQASPTLFVSLDFIMAMVASIVDFLLFIMLIYILKDHGFAGR